MKLDGTDLKILEQLKYNAKLSIRKFAKKINIPITTVHNRLKKLEATGIIKDYTVILDHEKLGKGTYAYILVTVTYEPFGVKPKNNQEEIAKKIRKLPEVEEVCLITGITDLIVRVRKKNVHKLNDFLVKELRPIKGVSRTQTLIVLKSL